MTTSDSLLVGRLCGRRRPPVSDRPGPGPVPGRPPRVRSDGTTVLGRSRADRVDSGTFLTPTS